MDASYSVKELTSAIYTAQLLDEDDLPIVAADLTSLQLTLYDIASGEFINGRDHQNVLNNGQGVIVDSGGLLTWTVAPADNTILSDRTKEEVHVAVFDYRWASGTKRFWHEIELRVQNQRKIS